MLWWEMSYYWYTRTSDNPEPEVWDDKNDLTDEEYDAMICEFLETDGQREE